MKLVTPKSYDNLTHYNTWAKVGGVMKLVTVRIRGKPYPRVFEDGREATYANVYTYGYRGCVNIKKLKVVKQE